MQPERETASVVHQESCISAGGEEILAEMTENETIRGDVMLKLASLVGLGAAAWYWRKDIGSMLETQFPGLREKTARTFDDAGDSAEKFYRRATSRLENG